MSNNPVLILYLYEPDQLSESSVHGSHVLFVHEGLIDLENHIAEDHSRSCFECVNICHNTAIGTFEHLRTNHNINRIFCHQETGHWQSFMRDKGIRKWCRSHSIPIIEFNQTGVTRCLKDRDEYHQKFKSFINRHCHKTPDVAKLRKRLIVLRDLPGYITTKKIDLNIFCEIPNEHRVDRPQRQQQGGIRQALATLESFLETRGSKFSQGISSPNTSWTSCSRLSPYLTWGHISLRHVIQSLQEKQKLLRQMKASGKDTGTWLKSLQAFSSRLHWRSHFIQKLESEPTMEKRDLCIAYQPLRRQEGDWKHQHYIAWIKGKTGFPFVDACMRCLVQHGWINFRMRAMLVSFATYNLWLDWKRLAPHLARVFLDYEPG
jgi:deoxyribodipyrimidine photo-lyase